MSKAEALEIVRAQPWPRTGKTYYQLASGVTVVATRSDRCACLTCLRADCEHARAVLAHHQAHGAALLAESFTDTAAAPQGTAA